MITPQQFSTLLWMRLRSLNQQDASKGYYAGYYGISGKVSPLSENSLIS